jgi:two-component system sensor histidine kinase TctE
MILAEGSRRSLTRRLLWVLITTLSAVAIGLGAGGTLLIHRVVEQSFDKLLSASLQEIAESLAPERGNVTLDIPPSALGILENDSRDNVYYSVRQGNRLLTGYEDLPAVSLAGTPPGDVAFAYFTFRGARVRIAAVTRRLPRLADPVVVEVAQTVGERESLALVMLAALYLLESSFVAIAALLVWPTLKWSLRPVNRFREELDARPADQVDFAPLDLRHAPTELVGLVGGFNHLLRRLEGAVAGMRQFTADASHQMRTPLAILKTHLAVLSQHVPPSNPGAGSLADIQGAVTRLEALLTRLITLAHADEAVRGGISRTSIDLRTVITQVAGDLIPMAAQHGITISVDAEQRPVWVHAEPVIAAEILENLLDNAIRYNRPEGTVCISIHEAAQSVSVSVEDDGPGVPEAERKHIFERFYRLPRDQARAGTGLGLSIVRTLSEALRAEVSIETASGGRGLKVSVQFEPARKVAERRSAMTAE